jgi:hypothetical protein
MMIVALGAATFINGLPGRHESADVPPPGVIWFGTSIDFGNFGGVNGHADTFRVGDPMCFWAHLSAPAAKGLQLSFLMDGTVLSSDSKDYSVAEFGWALDTTDYSIGQHTFVVEDAAGNKLAQGTVTIEPQGQSPPPVG